MSDSDWLVGQSSISETFIVFEEGEEGEEHEEKELLVVTEEELLVLELLGTLSEILGEFAFGGLANVK